jgi:hypothetical protein
MNAHWRFSPEKYKARQHETTRAAIQELLRYAAKIFHPAHR